MQTHSETIRIAGTEQGKFPTQAQASRTGSTPILFEEPTPAETLNTYLHHLCHYKRKPHHWLTPELCKLTLGKG